ncbi:MAG: nucleotidyltransferase domain-containing protein [Chloroflexi bacterium]|nr:MAG: nucleotidyltransferase domain-containing protein [Chloroflexota bacterium]
MFQITTGVHPTGFPPVAETLPKAVEKIVQELKPEKIILFGSYAYGNPTPDSDVDLLIIVETPAKRAERVVTVSNLLYPREFPVDILVKTPQELKDEIKHNSFLREITSKGKTLYERSR